jgi:hypothetical protein
LIKTTAAEQYTRASGEPGIFVLLNVAHYNNNKTRQNASARCVQLACLALPVCVEGSALVAYEQLGKLAACSTSLWFSATFVVASAVSSRIIRA